MKPSSPVPANETERLAALRRYRILYGEREEVFDRVTEMARSIFAADRASIAFVDADSVRFKSGGAYDRLAREACYSAHAIMSDEVLVIPDAYRETRHIIDLAGEKSTLRFYAGAPLVTRDGHRIGALCVIDDKPRPDLDQGQRQWLRTLAQLVTNELDLRLELSARYEAERDLELANRLVLAVAEAPSARAALETALRLIAEAVGAVHGSVFNAVPHDDTIQMIASYCANTFWLDLMERTQKRPLRRDQTLAGLALSRGSPVIYDIDAENGRYPHMGRLLADDAKMCIVVPIVQGGHEFTLHFFLATPSADAEALTRRISDLAAKVRPALVRKLSEDHIAILQSVALHANDAALVMVPDNASDPGSPLHIGYVNPAMTRMTGYALDELVGRPSSLLWGAEEEPLALETGLAGTPVRRELQCRRKDGSLFWADINAVPVDSGAAQGRHVVAVLRDITSQRELVEALKEREQTFHLMFAAAPVPMMLLDIKAQRYVEVNEAAIQLLGYSREQFLAMSAEAVRAPDEINRYRAMIQTPVPTSGRRGLWRYVKADGGLLTVDVSVHPFRSQGRAMAIIVTVDVTEQKRAEEQILQARDAAEAVSRAKSDLLANMSHELRTPLNAIIGFSQIMREELFGPLGNARYHGYVGDVLESARHLLAVINDILDLAKIEANSLSLKEKVVRPDDVVTAALRLVRPRADEAGIGLDFEERASDVAVLADETALKRVLVNLLTNAVKFSEPGTRVGVTCRITPERDLALAVVDHGIGMAPDEIPIALTPFQQVDIGLKRKYEGTGLGLPIAKQLIELHGGQLKIESARGVGTTVTIILPSARVVDNGHPADKVKASLHAATTAEVAALIG